MITYIAEMNLEWVPKIKNLAGRADQVHIMFNNCMSTYPMRNACDIAAPLGALPGKRKVSIADQLDLAFSGLTS